MVCSFYRISLAVCAVWVLGLSSAQASLNILFYGNSYTDERTINGGALYLPSVPDFIADLAAAAGEPTPTTVNASESAKDLAWHSSNNTGVISSGIASGQQWDFVVMQDQSVRPTTSHPSGDLAGHRASAVSLFTSVAIHSINAVPVMFETWAREQSSHTYYHPVTGYFPSGPAQMQSELRNGYELSAGDIDAFVGTPRARIAPVGDAWEATGFDNLHLSDNSHMNARGRLLSSLVIYSTIYQDDTHDLYLSGALNRMLSSLNLSAADGNELTTIADAAAGVTPSLLGDLDMDGFVGINDLNLILADWNESVPPANPLADPSGDGFVGIDDLNEVLGNWNAGTPPQGNAIPVVPEPGAALLCAVGVMTILQNRKVQDAHNEHRLAMWPGNLDRCQ